MRAINTALRRCQEEGKPCVIATIVRVEGSAYRREGARCLIYSDGQIVGILSGGCVEEDLREHAGNVLETGVSKILRYDFRSDGDMLWGMGQGCNGAVTIWLERFDPRSQSTSAAAVIADMETRITRSRDYWAMTVLEGKVEGRDIAGCRWNMSAGEGRTISPLPSEEPGAQAFATDVMSDLVLPQGDSGISTVVVTGSQVTLFIERIRVQPRLFIVGVGKDAELLSQMAAMVDWPATIVYHRTSLAKKARFPVADAVYHIPRGDYSPLAHSSTAYVVVMTHQVELDQEAVSQLLSMANIRYIGLLGSRSRVQQMIRQIIVGRESFCTEWLDKLHAPIGLDIGGDTPETISLSIMAELVAHRNGKPGNSLRPSSWLEHLGECSGREEL